MKVISQKVSSDAPNPNLDVIKFDKIHPQLKHLQLTVMVIQIPFSMCMEPIFFFVLYYSIIEILVIEDACKCQTDAEFMTEELALISVFSDAFGNFCSGICHLNSCASMQSTQNVNLNSWVLNPMPSHCASVS